MSSNRSNTNPIQSFHEGPTIPKIFREFGEQYIKTYQPPLDHIKFIRAVRLCKSPALGGKLMICKKCQHAHYIYFSCGHARCPCCQAIKREQWIDKMEKLLLDVPYIHLVTTMPHQLNRLAKANPKPIYNLLFRVTKMLVWSIVQDSTFVGATPGMVSVLHTFGSDLKYHVHTHNMVSFGGLSSNGKWVYPKHKKLLCRNSLLRQRFKDIFLKELKILFDQKLINYHLDYNQTVKDVLLKRWVVFTSHPSMTTQGITAYLAKYVNRIAISEKRVTYIKKSRLVSINYNDYRNQVDDQAPPIAQKVFQPLSFIHQLLQHLPPPYFHRTRRYGIHANVRSANTNLFIKQRMKNNPQTIRSVMRIIKDLMKLPSLKCQKCNHVDFDHYIILPNKSFIFQFITLPAIRAPSNP